MLKFVTSSLRALRCHRGATALEFALLGGVFFVTLLVALEVGRFFMTLQSMRNVIADAERWAMVNMDPGTLCGQQLLTAMGRSSFLGHSENLCVTRTVSGAQLNGIVTINVTLQSVDYPILVRAFGFTNVSLADSATFQYRR